MFGWLGLRSTAVRLSFGLVALTLSVISVAQVLGIFPDTTQTVINGRLSLCKAVGVHCAAAVQKGVDIDNLNAVTSSMVSQNSDVLSVGVRDAEGQLLIKVGQHESLWQRAPPEGSTPDYVRVPIFKDAQKWGEIEICFEPLHGGILGWLAHPVVATMLFMAITGFLAFMLYLRRTLKILNPQAVIPDRIQAMLNTLTEGVVVLDKHEQIVLANDAFATHIGMTSDKLQGKPISGLSWEADDPDTEIVFPWKHAIATGETKIGVALKLTGPSKDVRTIMVNAAPILGGDGGRRGALATFDDVTKVEQKNVQLNELVGMLKQSRDQISEQNEELKRLATRDPLTNCFNRRSLFEQFDSLWRVAGENGKDLGCVMFDIDRFKSINDTHGHAVGDQVLREIAEVLRSTVDEMDVVARYGGEEFCVLIRHGTIAQAAELAERIRIAIEERHCAGLDVTSSFGASSKSMGSGSPKDLLEEADKALYAAKHGGRNRVVRWDEVPAVEQETAAEAERSAVAQPDPVDEAHQEPLFIPYQAVTGLVAALTQRDAGTGQHSRRVADLCVLVAIDLMPPRERFLLEVAALLHDLGKLGVSDSILLKPDRLTEEEYRVMHLHAEMGMSIVSATFNCPELTRIVETHHAWFSGNESRPDLPSGADIPYEARILTIADAFDAMVSNKPYRKGCRDQEAFAELRRCAPSQFDPELVERFIEVVAPHRAQSGLEVAGELDRVIDQFVRVVEHHEKQPLPEILEQLKTAASQRGLAQIVQLASELERVMVSQDDIDKLDHLTRELLGLCQDTQQGLGPPSQASPSTESTQEGGEETAEDV